MCDLVGDPEREQLRTEAQAQGLVVGSSREVLEADKGNPPTVDNQLAGVSAAHAHHQVDVKLPVDLK